MPIGETLAQARQQVGLTVTQVSERTGSGKRSSGESASWALAQPVRVGAGVAQAELHPGRQRPGEYPTDGVLKGAAQQAHGAGCFESHRPPRLTACPDLGEFYQAPSHDSRRPDLRRIQVAGRREPAAAPGLADDN